MSGNICSTKLVSSWSNGRPFTHGAMQITFYYPCASQLNVEVEIEQFMLEQLDYSRGIEYHIPAWNYPNNTTPRSYLFVETATITFTSNEIFVMTKLMWDHK
jgi:hypothetical protein